MNKNTIGWAIALVVVLGLFYAFIVNTSKKVDLTPPVIKETPPPFISKCLDINGNELPAIKCAKG